MDSRHPRVESVQRELNRGIIPPDYAALSNELFHALEAVLRDTNILIAHNVPTLHKNLALTNALHQLATHAQVKLIAWAHDFAWDDPVYAGDLHNGAPWDLLKRAWDNTQYVVVSASRQRDLARLFAISPDEIRVVPPGVDAAEFFQVSETSAQWIRELNLLAAAPLFLLPARVTRRKNIELGIEIVNALRALGFAPKLVVMGPLGPHNPKNRAYLDELKMRAGDNIIFLQEFGVPRRHAPRAASPIARNDVAVGDAERRDLYAIADALLFPSAREGFGIPILEAGIARLPIFCADIPPFRETAQTFAHYFALDEAPTQIAARMAEFFHNDARYLLKRRVVNEYTWDAIFQNKLVPLFKRA
jgi:glycosyltransferase involved in cell wall biosynthesis